jgi:hypothetical protein
MTTEESETSIPTSKASSSASDGEPKRHPLDRWPVEAVLRSKINLAKYNPRTITKQGKKKLSKGLTKFGLAGILVWNKKTGVLVSGHQRLNEMDAVAAKDGLGDYTVDCKVVDLSEKDEKALNVALNNSNIGGEFDMTSLESLLNEGVDFADMGFDKLDVQLAFGDTDRLSSMFDDSKDKAAPDIDHIKNVKQEVKDAKARRKAEDDDPECYVTFMAESRADLDAFLTRFGLSMTARYQSLGSLVDAIEEVKLPRRVDHAAAIANREESCANP